MGAEFTHSPTQTPSIPATTGAVLGTEVVVLFFAQAKTLSASIMKIQVALNNAYTLPLALSEIAKIT